MKKKQKREMRGQLFLKKIQKREMKAQLFLKKKQKRDMRAQLFLKKKQKRKTTSQKVSSARDFPLSGPKGPQKMRPINKIVR